MEIVTAFELVGFVSLSSLTQFVYFLCLMSLGKKVSSAIQHEPVF